MTPRRISYAFMLVLFLLVGRLHMATLLLTALFSTFVLWRCCVRRSKPVAVLLFAVIVAAVGCGVWYFGRQAFIALPRIAETTIPAAAEYAQKRGIELPFSDWESLKAVLLNEIQMQFANIGRITREAGFVLLYLIIGIFVAVSLFLDPRIRLDDPGVTDRSLYALVTREIAARFRTFYGSFAKVMGAQMLIAAINAVLTTIFLLSAAFPYAMVLVVCTFLCGLVPIVGNIASNVLIVGVGFTISPKMAFVAIVFLVIIHKLEYFLNSRIIGRRIRSPMWLTLLGLVLGEKLMGIPGMILAPVVLHYIKTETSISSAAEEPKTPDA